MMTRFLILLITLNAIFPSAVFASLCSSTMTATITKGMTKTMSTLVVHQVKQVNNIQQSAESQKHHMSAPMPCHCPHQNSSLTTMKMTTSEMPCCDNNNTSDSDLPLLSMTCDSGCCASMGFSAVAIISSLIPPVLYQFIRQTRFWLHQFLYTYYLSRVTPSSRLILI
jgi:hypothetical protein